MIPIFLRDMRVFEGEGKGTGDTAPVKPWYDGKVDAETIGYLQNRGLHDKPLEIVALETIKAHREAAKFLGVPPNELIRLPKAEDAEGLRKVMQQLGAPADAKDYDFSSVKFDGAGLEPGFQDAVRAAAHALALPKDAALRFTDAVVKYLENADKSEATAAAEKLEAERGALKKNWGANFETNRIIAQNAAKALGIGPEVVAALEGQAGYAATMEMFRNIGTKIGEAAFLGGSTTNNGGVMTREQAVLRKAELMADTAWVQRYLAGGAPEKKEMSNLIALINASDA